MDAFGDQVRDKCEGQILGEQTRAGHPIYNLLPSALQSWVYDAGGVPGGLHLGRPFHY